LQPYVIVSKRRLYCSVRLDMLPPRRKLSPTEQAEAMILVSYYSMPGAEVCVGQDLVLSERVPAENAETLARRLVALGQRGAEMDAGLAA
jgi:hypothetical protein